MERFTLRLYLAAVCLVGLPILGLQVALDAGQMAGHWARILLLTPLVILSEVLPVRVQRAGEEEELTVSTTFSLALLFLVGVGPALAAMALASLVSDVSRHRPLGRAAFNVAQYALSLSAAAVVLNRLDPTVIAGGPFAANDAAALAVAALAFFVVNNTLPAVALALHQGEPVIGYLVDDLPFQALIAGLTLGMVPLVVSAASDSLVFAPLVILPLAAVYRSAATQARIAHEATHDALTGLPNRAHFGRRMDTLLRDATERDEAAAVVLVDLDRFKEVNDTLGHAAGDQLLCEIGRRLQATVRAGDAVARLGGDEFAILLPDATRDDTERICERVLHAVSLPVPVADATVNTGCSLGVALVPAHGRNAEEVLRHADVALYQAKRAHSGYQVYDRSRDASAHSRVSLLRELDGALTDGQFVVHYQPKANAVTRRIIGMEALVRWDHPVHGLLQPDSFIPLLEQSGLSARFTIHVMEQALAQIAAWEEAGFRLSVAVNVTGRNIHDGLFPAEVARLLAGRMLRPGTLQLEITETVIMADPVRVTNVLHTLRGHGVSLSLDDFGTGYSSLSYLGRLPLDELKIDKSFVMGMADSDSDAAIVRSTIDLAHNLGLRCVAEGVEDEECWQRLVEMECDVVQGYHLGRPRSGDEVTAWMDRLEDRHRFPESAEPLGPPPATRPNLTVVKDRPERFISA